MMPVKVSTTSARVQALRRILVADDNEMVCTALQGLLLSLGHSVDVVSNGGEAIEAAAREDFDFMVLGVQMPEMDGFEASRSLRHRPACRRRPRIIGLSSESEKRESYLAAGMDDLLVKPVRVPVLIDALEVHCPS